MKGTTLKIEKGIIQPSFGKMKRVKNLLFRMNIMQGGVLTEDGRPVRQSETAIYERELLRPVRIDTSTTDIKYVDADAIYFSNPQNHFGHVMTGTMAFAHILLSGKYSGHKIVFIDEEPCDAVKIFLEHLGVRRENIMTVTGYTQFKSVTVTEPSIYPKNMPRIGKMRFSVYREFIDTFRVIAEKFRCDGSPDKVYFSRGKLEGKTILCEDRVERVFQNNGYKIFHPEKLSLDEQIKLVANADSYACVQGTLEHHSLFMKDGAELIVMSRKKTLTERQVEINKLQKTIRHINIKTSVRPFGDSATPNIIGATEDLLRFFDERKFTYDANELKPTLEDLKEYIARCFAENKPRTMRYIFRRLIRRHKSYWDGMIY